MNLLLMVDQSLQLVLISHFHFPAELGGDSHCLSSVALPHSNCSVEVAVKPAKRLITSNSGPNGSLDTDALERATQYSNTPDHQTGLHLQCISFWRTNYIKTSSQYYLADMNPILPGLTHSTKKKKL